MDLQKQGVTSENCSFQGLRRENLIQACQKYTAFSRPFTKETHTLSRGHSELLMRLGISSIPIGRRSCRAVYFANTAANVDDYLRYHIREKDDFILIAGYTDNIFFNDERTNRVFKMEDVIIADDTKRWGEWA